MMGLRLEAKKEEAASDEEEEEEEELELEVERRRFLAGVTSWRWEDSNCILHRGRGCCCSCCRCCCRCCKAGDAWYRLSSNWWK